jgi:thioredoxin 1
MCCERLIFANINILIAVAMPYFPKILSSGLLVSFFLISCNSGTGQANASKTNPVETKTSSEKITDADFQQKLKDNAVVLVDFGATWCRPCRMQAPIVDSIAEKKKGKLLLIKVDVDQNREFTQKMQVSELPTLLLFKNGKQVWRSEGLMPAEMITDAIQNK